MNLVKPIHLTEWFERDVEDFLVLRPTSTSPQPVHVLNGFFHHSLSGRRAPRTAVDLVATKQGGEWAVGNNALRKKSPLSLPSDDYKLEKARRAVGALIAADRAVFPAYASFQIAHLGMVTSDRTHNRIGELASRLALRNHQARQSLTALIERLAHPQPNPHWALESVLSEPSAVESLKLEEGGGSSAWFGEASVSCATLTADLSDFMGRALELAVDATDSLLGLEVLAVSATFTALIVYAQVPSLCLGQPLVSLLCQASAPGDLASVRHASAATVDLLDGRFQSWLVSQLETELRQLFGSEVPQGEEAVDFATDCPVKKLTGGTDLTRSQVEEIYRAWHEDDEHSSVSALAHTLQEKLSSAMGNKVREWFAAVGRHCGFVGPRRGTMPRLRAEVSLVPPLLLAAIDRDDPETLPYHDWAERLASRFGIVVGTGEASRTMSPRAAEDELLENQRQMAALMTALGLARQYSDSVTEVINPFHLWTKR